MIELRPLERADLPLVRRWLQQPHVARWWLQDVTAEQQLQEYADRVTGRGDTATTILIVVEQDDGQRPVGWCQWYRWEDYPDEARELEADPGDVGLDYALGEPAAIGRGLGTAMIAALVNEVRRHHPGCGFVVEPDAANAGSRRVLEHNGFELVEIRPLAFEPNDRPMAIYRLGGGG
jgi:aminoglycoside 6'-N-acetyltransferase